MLINYSPEPVRTHLSLADGWVIAAVLAGELPQEGVLAIPGNDGVVIRLRWQG